MLKELDVKYELSEETRKQGIFINGKVFSLHITDQDEVIITDYLDYSKIYSVQSTSFFHMLEE